MADPQIRSISVYQSPTLVVTATRRHKPDKRNTTIEMVLTIGKPNFRGRQFVKACLKAGEPFPVKKPQIKWIKRIGKTKVRRTARRFYKV